VAKILVLKKFVEWNC